MSYAENGNAKIYYETYGDGPALVFAHGAGGNASSWWQQVPHFAERYRVITFDHRGFGRSTCPDEELDMKWPREALGIDGASVIPLSQRLPIQGGVSRPPRRSTAHATHRDTAGTDRQLAKRPRPQIRLVAPNGAPQHRECRRATPAARHRPNTGRPHRGGPGTKRALRRAGRADPGEGNRRCDRGSPEQDGPRERGRSPLRI